MTNHSQATHPYCLKSLRRSLFPVLFVLVFLFQRQKTTTTAALSATPSSISRPARGCAANPLNKKKVVVLGSGGYLGALTFGFLQRAASLYGTGIGGCRSIGGTDDTSMKLNRILSKNFCLAVADESYIKLTNLESVEAIQQRLEGWDALILGSTLSIERRPVTPNTYETTPNDKTWEVYWEAPRRTDALDGANPVTQTILKSVLKAAKASKLQHVVMVVDAGAKQDSTGTLQILEEADIPYTRILHGKLDDTKDYTYRKGVQGDMVCQTITALDDDSDQIPTDKPVAREDLAALCVQALLSLEWSTSRSFRVGCRGDNSNSLPPSSKRPDQEWCVRSSLLERSLQGLP